MEKIAIDKVRPNPKRDFELYPIDSAWVKELADSIKNNPGGLWPTYVGRWKDEKDEVFEICFGHHRFEALKLLGYKELEAEVKDFSDEEMFEVMSRENKRSPNEKVPFVVLKHDIFQALGGSNYTRVEFKRPTSGRKGEGFALELEGKMPWYSRGELRDGLTSVLAIVKSGISEKALNKIPYTKSVAIFVNSARKYKPPGEDDGQAMEDWHKAQHAVADDLKTGLIGRRKIDQDFQKRLGIKPSPPAKKKKKDEDEYEGLIVESMAKALVLSFKQLEIRLKELSQVELSTQDKKYLRRFIEEKVILGLRNFVKEVL